MPTIPLDALLVATGFTGALTLVWVARLFWSRWCPTVSITPHFSPTGGCADVVVQGLAAARREVLLVAARFTSRPVAQALVDAKLRGVAVEVILDPSNDHDERTQKHFLVEQGLLPRTDAERTIAANRVVVIDGKTVLTGSFDFTHEAEVGEELLVIRDAPALAHAYQSLYQPREAPPIVVQAETSTEESKPTPVESKEDVLTAVAQGLTAPATGEEGDSTAGAVVTPAAAELFARLRKEMAEAGEEAQEKAG